MNGFSRHPARFGMSRSLRDGPKWMNRNGNGRRAAIFVEFAFVIPIFLIFTLAIVEFSFVFFIRHSMLNAARDASRSYAIRELNEAESQQLALDRLSLINVNFTAQASPQAEASIDRWVEISVPFSEASLGDPLNFFGAENLIVRVTMRREE